MFEGPPMEYLLQILNEPGQTTWFFAIIMGVATTLFVLALLLLAAGLSDPMRRRLRSIANSGHHDRKTSDAVAEAIAPLSPYILPRQEWERSKTTTKLVHAGYRSGNALPLFYAIKLLSGIILPAAAIFLTTIFYPKFTTFQIVFLGLFLSFIGLLFPNSVLERLIKKRQRQIYNGFPDVLDLLITCTEAGLGLNAALKRVAEECAVSHPILSGELTLVNMEIRAGVNRVEALKNFSARAGIEDIHSFVAFLSQSLRFGTSIADTLRIYSDEFRDKRMQRAEEMAAKMGTKMIFPLIFCILPSFFLVAIGPAILGVLKALGVR
ncbi:type II secretion system F family protein [Nitrosococcus wardiae]|uniref:Type II secretion system F family protein n=2 Tax=Nitrosococcus wardiae TaxID=1814290 RepID=A0A4P7C0C1_9GAMM|nr:type II secretion system F family protein [Nitrosococcus wardiae]